MDNPAAASPPVPFVKLRPLAVAEPSRLAASFEEMAKSLRGAALKGTARFTLVGGPESQSYTISLDGKAEIGVKDKRVDLEIVTRPETWLAISEGKLAPLDAFTQGRMRVRGDHKLGIRIMRALAAGHGRIDLC